MLQVQFHCDVDYSCLVNSIRWYHTTPDNISTTQIKVRKMADLQLSRVFMKGNIALRCQGAGWSVGIILTLEGMTERAEMRCSTLLINPHSEEICSWIAAITVGCTPNLDLFSFTIIWRLYHLCCRTRFRDFMIIQIILSALKVISYWILFKILRQTW